MNSKKAIIKKDSRKDDKGESMEYETIEEDMVNQLIYTLTKHFVGKNNFANEKMLKVS